MKLDELIRYDVAPGTLSEPTPNGAFVAYAQVVWLMAKQTETIDVLQRRLTEQQDASRKIIENMGQLLTRKDDMIEAAAKALGYFED